MLDGPQRDFFIANNISNLSKNEIVGTKIISIICKFYLYALIFLSYYWLTPSTCTFGRLKQMLNIFKYKKNCYIPFLKIENFILNKD